MIETELEALKNKGQLRRIPNIENKTWDDILSELINT